MTTVDDVNNAIVGAVARATKAQSSINEVTVGAPGGIVQEMIARPDWLDNLEAYLNSMVEGASKTVCSFPEGVKIIPKYVSSSPLVEDVEIPESVELIEQNAFSFGSRIKSITIKGIPLDINEYAFNINKGSCDVYAPAMTVATFKAYPAYPFGMWNSYGEIRVHCSDGSFVV